DIDRSSKGPNRIAIDGTEFFVQGKILLRTAGNLFYWAMSMNSNAYMSDHRSNGLKVFAGKLLTTSFSSKQYKTSELVLNYHRNYKFYAFSQESLMIALKKRAVAFSHQESW